MFEFVFENEDSVDHVVPSSGLFPGYSSLVWQVSIVPDIRNVPCSTRRSMSRRLQISAILVNGHFGAFLPTPEIKEFPVSYLIFLRSLIYDL